MVPIAIVLAMEVVEVTAGTTAVTTLVVVAAGVTVVTAPAVVVAAVVVVVVATDGWVVIRDIGADVVADTAAEGRLVALGGPKVKPDVAGFAPNAKPEVRLVAPKDATVVAGAVTEAAVLKGVGNVSPTGAAAVVDCGTYEFAAAGAAVGTDDPSPGIVGLT